MVVFYQIFLVYFTHTLQTNSATRVFRPKTAILSKTTTKFSDKSAIFKNLPQNNPETIDSKQLLK